MIREEHATRFTNHASRFHESRFKDKQTLKAGSKLAQGGRGDSRRLQEAARHGADIFEFSLDHPQRRDLSCTLQRAVLCCQQLAVIVGMVRQSRGCFLALFQVFGSISRKISSRP